MHSLTLQLRNRDGGGFTATIGRGTSACAASAPAGENSAV
jgi:hypothetical protein